MCLKDAAGTQSLAFGIYIALQVALTYHLSRLPNNPGPLITLCTYKVFMFRRWLRSVCAKQWMPVRVKSEELAQGSPWKIPREQEQLATGGDERNCTDEPGTSKQYSAATPAAASASVAPAAAFSPLSFTSATQHAQLSDTRSKQSNPNFTAFEANALFIDASLTSRSSSSLYFPHIFHLHPSFLPSEQFAYPFVFACCCYVR